MTSELRLLRLDMADIKSSLKMLADSMEKCNSRLDNYEMRIKDLEEKDSHILSLQNTVAQLQGQLNQQYQANLKNELEIIGIEETTNENLEHIAMLVATKVGVNLPESEIDWVARAGPKKQKANSGKDQNAPRPIIVRLLRKGKRDEILKEAKVRRSMIVTSTDLGILGPPRNVYLNEHLTKENRTLFREARLRAKKHGFRFCWVSNSRLHVRKNEGTQAFAIRSFEDLERVLPASPLQTADPSIFQPQQ